MIRVRSPFPPVKSKPLEQLHGLLSRWEPILSSPVWYVSVIPQVQEWLRTLTTASVAVQDSAKSQLYDFFERSLETGGIALGPPRNWDGERMKIDTVVIHHTGNPPGLRLSRLSALELIRLYAPYFAKPTYAEDQLLKGQPIYSGHVRKGKQVFWPYHWIVRRNGHAERLLYDSEIGWHAGDWDVNRRSVAIALDGDYEKSRPSLIELEGIAGIVRLHYPQVPLTRIVGHREITSKTVCPSNLFS